MKEETTKICPDCGYDRLVAIGTQRIKMCPNCGNHEIPWLLAEGQKSPLTDQIGGQEPYMPPKVTELDDSDE